MNRYLPITYIYAREILDSRGNPTVEAEVVTKRLDVQTWHHAGDEHSMGHTSSWTDYYATFQVESGDRMEFEVDGSDYGLLVQGDIGKLSFQGTRYLGFERN